MPVRTLAFIQVGEGGEAIFHEAAERCVASSRAEPGALSYELWQESNGGKRFVFCEVYEDDHAAQAHLTSDHFKRFEAEISGILAAPPQIIALVAVDV